MKKIIGFFSLMGMGVFFLILSWSCVTNDQTPTFPDALDSYAVATNTPCGYPGLTCTPTPIVVMCLATPIARNTPLTGNTTFAGNDYVPTTCSGGASPDEVYRFTLATSQTVTITTDYPATAFDTVLVILSACNPPTQLTCDDDAGTGTTSMISGTLPAGTYWIVVDGFGGTQGNYQLGLLY